jgi:hypothetical protein
MMKQLKVSEPFQPKSNHTMMLIDSVYAMAAGNTLNAPNN